MNRLHTVDERGNRSLAVEESRESLRPARTVATDEGADPLRGSALATTTTALFRAAILLIAPTVALLAHGYHPWIGNPGEPEFLARLAAAVAADPTRWAVSHLGVAVGSGLVVLAFVAIRSHLHEAGENRWSALGLPFIVMGGVLYAMLPAIEFAPHGAFHAGADPAAVQAALMSWFVPILLTSAALFAVGAIAFAIGIARSAVLSPGWTWLVVFALVVMAATRFFPVGAAQLYVGPAAGVVALWPLAFVIWKQQHAQARAGPRS